MAQHFWHIRLAEPKDAAFIVELAMILGEEEGRKSLANENSVLQDMIGEQAYCTTFVADQEGECLGFAMCYPGYDLESASVGFHLGDIVVHPSYRRQNIGKSLMKALSQHTLQNGGKWLSWTVMKQNHAAIQFYKQCQAHTIPITFMALGKQELQNCVKK